METVKYTVEGMINSNSKTKLKNSLDKIEGVQKVAVDLSRGTVEIKYNNPASLESIKSCIENTGYMVQ